MNAESSNLSYLPGLTRLECLKDGFESIPAGTILPMRVRLEEYIIRDQPPGAPGVTIKGRSPVSGMTIQLTAPDGTRHIFHTHPDLHAVAPPNPQVRRYPISTFVEFFHIPVPPGLESKSPHSNALLELLEAITTAYADRGL